MIRTPTTLLPPELAAWNEKIRGYAKGYGLDFFDVIFEVLDYDELNEVAAYGGFPTRYPHWRFGMDYEELSKGYSYGLQKIYELVINNNPCYAYLLKCNHVVDQKLVMAHVYGHCDFFKNNYWFSQTNRKMLDEMANHATRIRRYIELHGLENVESFVDACLSIDNLIDVHAPFIQRRRTKPRSELDEDEEKKTVKKIRSKEYMDRYVNPPDFMERQKKQLEEELRKQKNFPEEPQKDILHFLLEHAPLERWQRDVLDIVREEAYYFAPQGMTKIMNEGWACVARGTLIYTSGGIVPMGDLVSGAADVVSDGERERSVYDRNIIRDHETIEIRTRRGLKLCGSTNHRILLADGSTWKRLDELAGGERVAISGGAGLWPATELALSWSPGGRLNLSDVAAESGVPEWAVNDYRRGRCRKYAAVLEPALARYESQSSFATMPRRRNRVAIPAVVDTKLATFLGYLVGDGHVSRVKHHFGLTTGDEVQALAFAQLVRELFAIEPRLKKDEGRWRVFAHSETISDFLVEALDITTGPSARRKRIPDAVLRSPESVVRAFLAAYFDCDGYAGEQGFILSTTSDALAEQTQLLLLNFGILSRRRPQPKGCWHVHVAGASAKVLAEKIGFGLARKQQALEAYVSGHEWFKKETWDDEIVSIERGRADVYDISVEETHRYAAGGFINHNSFWHSRIMTQKALTDAEVIDYADHHSGTMGTRPGALNPYKVGIELFRDIEERWNKGRFGKEWEECDDIDRKRSWDKKLGMGNEKIYEVRRIYNDVLFIDEFLTPEFCDEHKLFTYEYNPQTGEYVITNRDFKKVKEKLLFQLTNFGHPYIYVEDGNWENRGELFLRHRHEGIDLKVDYAKETLRNLQTIWSRPVHIETVVDKRKKLLSYDGKKHYEKTLP